MSTTFVIGDLGHGPVNRNEALPSCSFFCEAAEAIYTENDELDKREQR